MKLCILLSTLDAQEPYFTTFFLAREALARGHRVSFARYADLQVGVDGEPRARLTTVDDPQPSRRAFFDALAAAPREGPRPLAELDAFWVRTDWPELTAFGHPLAPQLVVQIAHLLEARGVLVLPDVGALGLGDGKLYLDQFPAAIRPRSFTTLDREDLRAFAREVGGTVVVKPAIGAEGRHVFLYRLDAPENINQIFDVVAASGFVYAQEYVHDPRRRSTRLFLFDGDLLLHEGRCASVTLTAAPGELRSNAMNGGTSGPAAPSEAMLEAARPIARRLRADGFFLSAVDFVGEKVIEVNQMNVGGIRGAQRFHGVNFSARVIDGLERRLGSR